MKKNEQLYRIAIGNLINDKIENIKEFEGNKKELILFMNKEYSKRFLANFREDNVVFNFVYQNKNELLDINNWASLDELKELGIIEYEVK